MKSIVWNVVLVLVLMGWSGMAQGGLIINETFSTDPGWTRITSGYNDFGYNSYQGNIARCDYLGGTSEYAGLWYDDGPTSRYAKDLPAPVSETTDFTFSYDYSIVGGSGSILLGGLFKSGANNFNGTARGVTVLTWTTGLSQLFVFTDGGWQRGGAATVIGTGQMQVQYVAATKTFTWSFTNSDNVASSDSFSLASGYTFQSDQFGVGNYDQGFDYTYGAFTVDNMYLNVVPEPISLSLLGLGGLALIRRRWLR